MKLFITLQFGSYGSLSLTGGFAWLLVGALALFMLFVVYLLAMLFR